MASIFTRIINGEIPCHKVAENEYCFAFLDINPLGKGHTLVVPKKEVDYIFDLDSEIYSHLMNFSKEVSSALLKSVDCKRIGMTVIGLEVPHAHVHLIPINSIVDMDFSQPKLNLSPEELTHMARSIAENME